MAAISNMIDSLVSDVETWFNHIFSDIIKDIDAPIENMINKQETNITNKLTSDITNTVQGAAQKTGIVSRTGIVNQTTNTTNQVTNSTGPGPINQGTGNTNTTNKVNTASTKYSTNISSLPKWLQADIKSGEEYEDTQNGITYV